MASEIRVNTFKNRSGLGTVSINDSGASFSGVVTATGGFSGDLTGNVTSSSTSTFSNGLNVTGGDVGIGTDNPGAPLDVVTNSSAEGIRVRGRSSDSIGSLYFYNHTSATPYGLVQGRSTDFRLGSESNTPVIFNVNSSEVARFNTSGNLAFPSGQGIDFSANSNAAGMTSELLDDYEEGTWTPSVTFGGGSTGITGTFTGSYTKIGRQVYVGFYLLFTNKGSSTGAVRVGGLPFTIANGYQLVTGYSYLHRLAMAQTDGQITTIHDGSTFFTFNKAGYSNGNAAQLTDSDFFNSTVIGGGITYYVS